MTEFEQGEQEAPLEFRSSAVAGVNFAQRIIEVIAVPYEQEAAVEYRSELWKESFARGAFDGIEKRPNRVRANIDHDNRRLIGKVVTFYPSRDEGLVAEVRISQTLLGDETLALADDGVLAASVGFTTRARDQVFNRAARTRRIVKAFVDHLALTATPVYAGADVLSVRSDGRAGPAASLPPLVTPALDELSAWLRARQPH